jgi:glycosyltransferase involved in cell wall biosynthesis
MLLKKEYYMMKKMLFVRGNYPINPRSEKMRSILENKYKLKFIYWDRKKKVKLNEDHDFFFYQSSNIVNSKFKKMLSIIGFYRFLKKTLKEYKPDIIYAYHWDMFLLTKLAIKKQEIDIIYDVSDMPDYEGTMFKFLKKFEEFFLANNVHLIFASKYFQPFYKKFKNKKVIIDNKPYQSFSNSRKVNLSVKYDFNIIYVGNIKYKEILVNLVDAVKDLNVNLLFFGGGYDEVYMRDYCENLNNIYFFGQYEMEEIHSFYSIGDVAWAAYPSKSINVKYATSNKYFESLVNKVPCIFSAETELGKDVSNQRIGFIVNPYDVNDIRNLIQRLINSDELKIVKNNIINISEKDIIWESEVEKLRIFLEEIDGNPSDN